MVEGLITMGKWKGKEERLLEVDRIDMWDRLVEKGQYVAFLVDEHDN